MTTADVRPFNARSLVLSVLLGLPDPRLSTAAIVRLGGHFDLAAGTMRTAVSRMVGAGELIRNDDEYRLTGSLLDRKHAQDAGRRPSPSAWDGSWWTLVTTAPRRTLTERRQFRTAMTNARMGELRPDAWLRPANLGQDPTGGASGMAAVRGPIVGIDPGALARRLWDLDALAARCRELAERIDVDVDDLSRRGPVALPTTMPRSADIVRFLRVEPRLPAELVPANWPVDDLRRRYRTLDQALGRALGVARE
ncbi:PaaX family transcriptional regulator C-terminal domain-containing protein [soil metagenome]